MQRRARNITTIQYILVGNGSPIISTILPPADFKNEVLDFLKSCPIDIFQIKDSLDFLEAYKRYQWSFGYDFHVFNVVDYHSLKDYFNSSKQLQLFFLDGSSKDHWELLIELKSQADQLRYFYFYNAPDLKMEADDVVQNPTQFIEKIVFNQKKILKFLGNDTVEINPSVAIEFKDYNKYFYFSPTQTNHYLLNKIVGNFGKIKSEEQPSINKLGEESTKALAKTHSFDRQNLFVEQINKIDYFFKILINEEIIKPVTGHEALLPPLIFVAPFHNPDLKKIYSDEKLINLLQVEQTENYTNETKVDGEVEQLMAGIELMIERIKYLDGVSFLHSSFTFSPVMRLPIKGKSVYRELSFFRPELFPDISRSKNRRKLKRTIHAFGSFYKKSSISPAIEKIVEKRNGQIVAISDLPIEWLVINGIPLSFTHDVCRLPETSLHGLMSFFTNNQAVEFSIPKDIIKRTLVIHGAHDGFFALWQTMSEDLAKDKGFILRKCTTVEQVKASIEEIKPLFLIFDCHGGYDNKTKATFLHIGNERLDGSFIVENNITAPLIFLSACGTAPTYGTFNPIANAFFEAGAISVTSTYLPININTGSVLYLRILNNLEYAAGKSIHKNWLEFICHVIRTSSINDAFLLAADKFYNTDRDKWTTTNTEILTESMYFSKRRELYNSLDKRISTLASDQRLYYSEVIPEFLLYSNLGRGDLVLFESWKEEFLKKNN
jgi:hypothetical protein